MSELVRKINKVYEMPKDTSNSYLYRLLKDATDKKSDGNEKMGNYSVKSCHGQNVYLWDIYKNGTQIARVKVDGYTTAVSVYFHEVTVLKDMFRIVSSFSRIYETQIGIGKL